MGLTLIKPGSDGIDLPTYTNKTGAADTDWFDLPSLA